MKEEITIKIDRESDNTAAIEELRSLLKPFGISVEASTGEMWLEYDPKAVDQNRTRGAGRKQKSSEKTIAEAFTYSLTHTMKEIAEFTGLSESTCKRLIKRYRDNGLWHADMDLLYFGN